MKKFILLFVLTIVSCSSESDSSINLQNDSIIGTWAWTTLKVYNSNNEVVYDFSTETYSSSICQYQVTNPNIWDCELSSTIEFTENQMIERNYKDVYSTSCYGTLNENIDIDECSLHYESIMNYELNGNILNLFNHESLYNFICEMFDPNPEEIQIEIEYNISDNKLYWITYQTMNENDDICFPQDDYSIVWEYTKL